MDEAVPREVLQTLISEALEAPGRLHLDAVASSSSSSSSSQRRYRLHSDPLTIFFFHFLLMRVHFTK